MTAVFAIAALVFAIAFVAGFFWLVWEVESALHRWRKGS